MPMERRLRKSDFTRWFSSEGKSILYPHPSIPVLHHTYTFPSTSSPTFLYYGQELSIGHDGAQGFQERGVDGPVMGKGLGTPLWGCGISRMTMTIMITIVLLGMGICLPIAESTKCECIQNLFSEIDIHSWFFMLNEV